MTVSRVASFNSDGRHMAALERAAAYARLTLRRSRRQAICGFCHLPIIIRCVHPGVRATAAPINTTVERGHGLASGPGVRKYKSAGAGAQWSSNRSLSSPER